MAINQQMSTIGNKKMRVCNDFFEKFENCFSSDRCSNENMGPILNKFSCFLADLRGLKRKREDFPSNSPPLHKSDDLCEDSERMKKKKVRTTFTGRQIFELEKMFETKKYLSSSERTELAKMLNVTEQQVSRFIFIFLHTATLG